MEQTHIQQQHRLTRIAGALLCACGLLAADIQGPAAMAQQVTIPRIELMPRLPAPYLMRNWKDVAREYDAFVYDINRTGQFLPLVWWNTATVNYPGEKSYGLDSYVGTSRAQSGEAINVLPSVVGATLCGVDKSAQGGVNWVRMCREYFNKRASENVYLNGPSSQSGDDWWYDTMPNVFFYELAWLYPGTEDFDAQFRSVADRWLQAVQALGGGTTPWAVPNMNYRAFALSTMTPLTTGVKEPEAAGAIGWLLYMAYTKTGERKYREGAEQCMEFLNGLASNPAYELQLSYGAYLAARMNAELGTAYNVGKIVNWCFDVGPLRNWGAIVGTWGGLDCSGLIGEVNGSNDYAFYMNTCEQIGALVPMVRYDTRFARPIGRWVLNAANASRLFYPNYLPDSLQDSRAWSKQYDSASVIAHEALRQNINGRSPFATGDAISGGWAQTNLALYGSSHVGFMGAVVDTTDIQGILRLDMTRTDFYHAPSFPTYLFYNPYAETKQVTVLTSQQPVDLYDAALHAYVAKGVTGSYAVPVSPDSARVLVVIPSGHAVSYQGRHMLVDSVVVDYAGNPAPGNLPPRLKGMGAVPAKTYKNHDVTLYATVQDPDGDSATVTWSSTRGTITRNGPVGLWRSPDTNGTFWLACAAVDGKGGTDRDSITVAVVDSTGPPPQIVGLEARPGKIDLNKTSVITCHAFDPSGGALQYVWSANAGTLQPADSTAVWTAPAAASDYTVRCIVTNPEGSSASDSIRIEVRDFSKVVKGSLLAWYALDGNATDATPHANNGTIVGSGALFVADRFGVPSHALSLNGLSAAVEVPNQTYLNTPSISVSFWFQPSIFYDREQYIVSHGNWQNRWKASISGTRLRWTVVTTTGVHDLDSRSVLTLNTYHHAVLVYSGSEMEIYLDGELDAFVPWSGALNASPVDLMIGQSLPGDSRYNFRGDMDDVRLYDYPLLPDDVTGLFSGTSGVSDENGRELPEAVELLPNYPNPFNPLTTITFGLPRAADAVVRVYSLLGQAVADLAGGYYQAGWHSVRWDARNFPSGCYFVSLTAGSVHRIIRMLLVR